MRQDLLGDVAININLKRNIFRVLELRVAFEGPLLVGDRIAAVVAKRAVDGDGGLAEVVGVENAHTLTLFEGAVEFHDVVNVVAAELFAFGAEALLILQLFRRIFDPEFPCDVAKAFAARK